MLQSICTDSPFFLHVQAVQSRFACNEKWCNDLTHSRATCSCACWTTAAPRRSCAAAWPAGCYMPPATGFQLRQHRVTHLFYFCTPRVLYHANNCLGHCRTIHRSCDPPGFGTEEKSANVIIEICTTITRSKDDMSCHDKSDPSQENPSPDFQKKKLSRKFFTLNFFPIGQNCCLGLRVQMS